METFFHLLDRLARFAEESLMRLLAMFEGTSYKIDAQSNLFIYLRFALLRLC